MKTRRHMNYLLLWKILLWGAPIIGGLLAFLANYKIDQIEPSKPTNQGDTYNISSVNQSGGFVGVINNDLDKLQEIEALRLLDEVQKSPNKYSAIYDRFNLLPLPVNQFSKFRILI